MEINQVSRQYKKMRNKGVGDYLYSLKNDRFNFIIADMPTDYQAMVFIHEFVEAYLCWKAGIKEKDINAFDKMFEQEREAGLQKPNVEPGDDMRAIYFKQHQIATKFEKKLCKALGISWYKYDKFIQEIGG